MVAVMALTVLIGGHRSGILSVSHAIRQNVVDVAAAGPAKKISRGSGTTRKWLERNRPTEVLTMGKPASAVAVSDLLGTQSDLL